MITLYRQNLKLILSADTIPSQGSSDVPIQFVNDEETYQNYIIECRVGWYENGCMKSVVAGYSDGIIKLPAQAFRYNGRIAIVIALIDNTDSNHIEVTKEVTPMITSAPLGDVELPETETWQTAVENLVRQLNAQLQIEIDEALKNSQKALTDANLAIEHANNTNDLINQKINDGSFIPDINVNVKDLPEGSKATVSESGEKENPLFTIGIPTGKTGVTPNITANATVNNTTGTPSVEVEKTGTKENPVFSFNFQNLKGVKGDKGDPGKGAENAIENNTSNTVTNDFKIINDSKNALSFSVNPTNSNQKSLDIGDDEVETHLYGDYIKFFSRKDAYLNGNKIALKKDSDVLYLTGESIINYEYFGKYFIYAPNNREVFDIDIPVERYARKLLIELNNPQNSLFSFTFYDQTKELGNVQKTGTFYMELYDDYFSRIKIENLDILHDPISVNIYISK